MINLKQYLKNVVLVTILEKKENYGTEAQVVEFGCMRILPVGDSTDGYLCDICFKIA